MAFLTSATCKAIILYIFPFIVSTKSVPDKDFVCLHIFRLFVWAPVSKVVLIFRTIILHDNREKYNDFIEVWKRLITVYVPGPAQVAIVYVVDVAAFSNDSMIIKYQSALL